MDRRTVLALLAMAIAVPAMATSRARKMKATVTSTLNYLSFLPKSYSAKGAGVPLILFLHGSGERGTDLEKVKAWGPPAIAEKDSNFPFIEKGTLPGKYKTQEVYRRKIWFYRQ